MPRRFSVKNLLVQVRTGPGQLQQLCFKETVCHIVISRVLSQGCCRFPTDFCRNIYSPNPCDLFTPCGYFSPDPCGYFSPDPCGAFSPVVVDPRDLLTNPESLAVLKQQLQDALEDITKHEAALTEQLRPQTAEEMDQLEGELKAALDELQSRRNQLRGKKG